MRLKKMILALFACLALTAVAASAAQAGWTIEGVSTFPSSEAVSVEGSSSTLTGTFSGATIELSSTTLGCSGTCTIDNTKEAGHGKVQLVFNGQAVSKPANRTIMSPGQTNGVVVTKPLTSKVIMDPTSGSTVVADLFFTDKGPFAELEFTGGKCTLNELRISLNGTIAGESSGTTCTLVVVRGLSFGSSQRATIGANLFFGTNLKHTPSSLARHPPN